VVIQYHPHQRFVETESIWDLMKGMEKKRISHEALPDYIRTPLLAALEPHWAEVITTYLPRSGLICTTTS
jgi:NADPH-dependent 7-cyano-7-deazaguanine reductase QueF